MSENTTPAVPTPEGQMRTRDRDELAEVARCPGCGSVIDPNRHTCYPLKVDATQPGYRYLEGIWGYCLTLSRDVRLGDDWLARRDRQVAAEAVRSARAELASMLEHYPQGGSHTRATWAVGMLEILADRIEAGDQ